MGYFLSEKSFNTSLKKSAMDGTTLALRANHINAHTGQNRSLHTDRADQIITHRSGRSYHYTQIENIRTLHSTDRGDHCTQIGQIRSLHRSGRSSHSTDRADQIPHAHWAGEIISHRSGTSDHTDRADQIITQIGQIRSSHTPDR